MGYKLFLRRLPEKVEKDLQRHRTFPQHQMVPQVTVKNEAMELRGLHSIGKREACRQMMAEEMLLSL